MVPAAFISLADIPLNSNGKVDRGALGRIDASIASGREYVAPRNPAETQLVQIWAEVLKLATGKIGVNDSFFELGGHSLSTVQLLAKINKRFGQVLPLAIVFTAPTIAELAEVIVNCKIMAQDILVPIQRAGHERPVFGIPGAGGNVLSLRPLSRMLGATQPFYGLQAVGLDGKTSPPESVEETAKLNIAALKTVQPEGPYSLIGHSYGGAVAFEMAHILLGQGEEVSSLILIDSMVPSIVQGVEIRDEAAELFDMCKVMASLYGMELDIDLSKMRQSSGAENIEYVISALSHIDIEVNAGQLAAFLKVYRTNLSCYRTYKPSKLPRAVDVSLHRATQRLQGGPGLPSDYGWNQFLQHPIRIHDVDAGHFSILEKNIFSIQAENSQHGQHFAKSAD
jgi:thioesterase domain-containing protein/acyl carrier protein